MPNSIECFICGDQRPNSLEEHHIVPQRYNGSDEPENLVQLCSSCHAAVEKLYDDSFYERLGAEAVEQIGSEDLDTEGTTLQPHETKDRDFPRYPVHISEEDFCINIAFSQFFLYPAQNIISDYYPESDVLIERLEQEKESIIDFFKADDFTLGSYTVHPNNTRLTPIVKVVPTKDRPNTNLSVGLEDGDTESSGLISPTIHNRQRDYAADIDTHSSMSSDFQRLHCGYCHTVYSGNEQADLAAHLRTKHRVEEPYLDESEIQDDSNFNLLRRTE